MREFAVNKYASLGFTKDQEVALDKLDAFYNSDQLIFTLEGYAGTGKTYILNYFINNIVNKPMCVTAPTHKAVRVVEKITNRTGKTLQSLHGLRPNVLMEDFNIDRLKFDTLGQPKIRDYHIVIIDECSMINADLRYLNEIRAKQYNTKIVYVGDPLQLPPVGERLSSTFGINKATLTTIVRQDEDNPMRILLSKLRSDALTSKSSFLEYISKNRHAFNERGEGFACLNKAQFANEVKIMFKSDLFSNDINHCRIIAWRNDTVAYWNKVVRGGVVSNPNKLIDKDDLMTGYNTIVNEFLVPLITNSDDYIVDDLEERISDRGFKVVNVNLINIFTGMFTGMLNIVDHTDATFKKFYAIINDLHQTAIYTSPSNKARAWREYYAFKNAYLVSTRIPLLSKGDTKPRGVVKKDLDYGYGLTVHKSQGSTYNTVFVDVNDIIEYTDGTRVYNTKRNPHAIEMRNKLLYVALSRASKNVILLY